MKKTALIALTALLSLPLAADPLNYNVLHFSESVVKELPNDWMTVQLQVVSRHADAARATAETTRKLNALQARVRSLSGAETALSGRHAYQTYETRDRRVWEDRAYLTVSSADFQALGKLIAQSSNEATVGHIQFSLKDETRRRTVEELSVEALKRFQQRAQILSRAMGGSGYRVVQVNLQQNLVAQSAMAKDSMVFRAAAADSAAPEPTFDNPGTSTVQQTANGTIQY